MVAAACALSVAVPLAGVPSNAQAAAGDGTLTVTVTRDVNGNGLKDSGEAGQQGIQVQLIDDAGNRSAVKTSSAAGTATFAPADLSGLTGGVYRVEAKAPTGSPQLYPAPVNNLTGPYAQDAHPATSKATAPNAFAPMTTFVDLSGGKNRTLAMGVWNPNDLAKTTHTANPKFFTVVNVGNGSKTDSTANAVRDGSTGVMSFDYGVGYLGTASSSDVSGYGLRSRATAAAVAGKAGTSLFAKANEIGSVWGVAAKSNSEVFVAAANRWGVDVGPQGLFAERTDTQNYRGAIYRLTAAEAANSNAPKTPYTRITNAGNAISNLQTPNVSTNAPWSLDIQENYRLPWWKQIGKSGMGDIDMSTDKQSIYAMNLEQKMVTKVPAAGAPATMASTTTNSRQVPTPAGCSAGDWRPWGIGVNGGYVYMGGVCSAESTGSSAGLRIAIARVAEAQLVSATPVEWVYNEALLARDDISGVYAASSGVWKAWGTEDPTGSARNNSVPWLTPLLSDIEFDSSGSLILGMTNRNSLMNGAAASSASGSGGWGTFWMLGGGGDVLKLCKAGAGFVQSGTCANPSQEDKGGTRRPEWFVGDFSALDSTNEAALGGISYVTLPDGTEKLLTTAYDPLVVWSGGVLWLDGKTGRRESPGSSTPDPDTRIDCQYGYGALGTMTIQLPGSDVNGRCQIGRLSPAQASAGFAKANGLGDLEVVPDVAVTAAPLQIGNRVWIDTDKNGVQDPGEKPVANAWVYLYAPGGAGVTPGAELGRAQTNDRGEYYFDDSNVPGGLKPNTDYVIAVPGFNFNPGYPLYGYLPTTPDSGAATNAGADENDSDGVPVNSTAAAFAIAGTAVKAPGVRVRTGGPGQDNHSYDFGFVQPRASVEVDKWDGDHTPSGLPLNKPDLKDALDAVAPEGKRVDADTKENAAEYAAGEQRKVSWRAYNSGESPLVNVTLVDTTVTGPQLQASPVPVCRFPDGTQTNGVWNASAKTWSFTWANTKTSGTTQAVSQWMPTGPAPKDPKSFIECTGYLTLNANETHRDDVEVTSTPAFDRRVIPGLPPVTDDDPFNAKASSEAAISWVKVAEGDASEEPLKGAEWTLQMLDAAGQPTGPVIAVADCVAAGCTGRDSDPVAGRFAVTGLSEGTWRLIETKAPAGYMRRTEPIDIVVRAGAPGATTDGAGNIVLAHGPVTNKQQLVPGLPFTGGLGMDYLLMGGGLVVLLAGGAAAWLSVSKRRAALE